MVREPSRVVGLDGLGDVRAGAVAALAQAARYYG